MIGYLDQVDPEAARRARIRYSCFDHFGKDPQTHGYATSFGAAESCEDEVVGQLIELHRHADDLVSSYRIGIDVSQGVATLSGKVADEVERERAAEVARRVPGVKQVINNIEISQEAAP